MEDPKLITLKDIKEILKSEKILPSQIYSKPELIADSNLKKEIENQLKLEEIYAKENEKERKKQKEKEEGDASFIPGDDEPSAGEGGGSEESGINFIPD
jgi:hypothetical protein